MRLAFITTGILPQPAVKGGAVEGLLDLLLEYNETHRSHSIEVYSIYDKDASKVATKYKNTKFYYFKRNRVIQYLYNKGCIPVRIICCLFINKILRKISSRNEYDVVIIQNEYKYAHGLRKVLGKTPIILHLHNDYINVHTVRPTDRNLNSLNGIITISNYLESLVKSVSNVINIKTIYNGTDIKRYHETYLDKDRIRQKLRNKYGISQEEMVIIFAGRLCEEKGIMELLKAFLNIPETYNARLVIVGNSMFAESKESAFVKQIKSIALKKSERIIFTGYIAHESMPDIYAMADIGCIPSIWEEPFGLTVIEQMASGLPLIVSDSGAIPEIVNDECAITVERGENFENNLQKAIIKLYNDKNLRFSMGNSGRKIVEKFSLLSFTNSVYDYIEMFEE